MTKTAVILMNLGGPDKKESIRPFLMNFFMDKNIIRLPYPLRYCVASMIARRRTQREARESYGELGDRSPLLDNTKAQAEALQHALGDDFSVHVHMRYWHPMADEVAQGVKRQNPLNIILLPLYPQYSTTTTRSSLQELEKAFRRHDITAPVSTICCYPFHGGFIKASAGLVRAAYEKMDPAPRVLFSAHGLPVDIVKDGDPYQWQCEEAAGKIAAATGIADMDWQICYQSRVGPKRWLTPSTEDALAQAAKDGKTVLVYPHAFVSEHVETLVELDVEYRELAAHLGIPAYERVPTVGIHQAFIGGLAAMVRARCGAPETGIAANEGGRICPKTFRRCAMDRCSQLKGFAGHARHAA